MGVVINLYFYSSHLLNRVKQQRIQLWLNHYFHHNRTEEQNKSPSVQRNDTLTIFPYIKSTKLLQECDSPLLTLNDQCITSAFSAF